MFDIEKRGYLTREQFRAMMRATLSTRDITLKLLMKSERGHEALLQFAQHEFSDENIEFIDAVSEWHDLEDLSVAGASDIMATYINDGAKSPVNVSSKTRKKLIAVYTAASESEEKLLTKDVFEDALSNIYKLIEKDMFVRFQKQSEQMDTLIDSFFDEVDVDGNKTVDNEEYKHWAMNKRPEALVFLENIKKKCPRVAVEETARDEDKGDSRLSACIVLSDPGTVPAADQSPAARKRTKTTISVGGRQKASVMPDELPILEGDEAGDVDEGGAPPKD